MSEPSPTRPPIVILGAGCAGLAAAYHLLQQKDPRRILILEKDDHVGGLAGGIVINENVYEYGPHIFHTTDPRILNDVKTIVGADLLPYKRTIKIKFLSRYFSFPLRIRDIFLKLPIPTVIHAGFSFVWHFIVGRIFRPRVETSETILKRYYGSVLYELFFNSYIKSVWGIPASEFSPAFARERIPRINFLGAVDKVVKYFSRKLNPRVSTSNYVEKVEGELFTTKKGFSLITEKFSEKITEMGGEIRLNAKVIGIKSEAGRAKSVTFAQDGKTHELECSGIVNTLPLNLTIKMISPKPSPEIIQSAGALRFRAIVFVGILVNKAKVLPASFMYFREHSFNRVSDLGQMGFEVKPEGHTLLVAEVSCNTSDRTWTDEAYVKDIVLHDLKVEGLVSDDNIVEVHAFHSEHAYPMYILNYEDHLKTLLKYISGYSNLVTAGRQGRFQYINTHIAMKMGYEAADELLAKTDRQ